MNMKIFARVGTDGTESLPGGIFGVSSGILQVQAEW